MTEAEAVAQEQVQAVVEELTKIRLVLAGICSSLPEPPRADFFAEEEPSDVASRLRSTIDCVVHDQILPAIRDLQAAAVYRPKEEPP